MIEKPKRPDCNSCYHFSKSDFNETEGYCRVCKKHLNSKEGEECEQFEPYSLYCDTDSVDISSSCPNVLFDTRAIKPEKYEELHEQDFDTWLGTILHEIIDQVNLNASEVDCLGDAVWNGECPDGTPYPKQCAREDAYIQCIRQSNRLDGFMKNVDITVNSLTARIELLDSKIDTLKHLFDELEAQINDLSLRFDEFKKFVGYTLADPATSPRTCSNFCGNCAHYQEPTSSVILPTCKLSGEIVDPDDLSCAMFEHLFTHTGKVPHDERPDWLEKTSKTMTTPSEPSVGCTDCKHARNGMCVKYNCSLGAICATPECHESYPF